MIRVVEETGSTNDDMAARAAAGAAEGEWLVARRQTGGRGRQGRVWTAPAGNLSMSGLVRIGGGDPPAQTLALAVGVAVQEVVAAYLPPGRDALLKWPNDLLVAGAKIAGILLERRDAAVIVGIGLNIAAAPALDDRAATSLSAEGGAMPDPADAAADVAAAVARWLGRWRGEGLAPVRQQWLARAHPPGTALRVRGEGGAIDGLFAGLDAGGALLLRMADGAVRTIHAGDVALL